MKKKWFYYFGYVTIIFTVLLLYLWYIDNLRKTGAKNYNFSMQLMYLPIICSVIFGILLGLEKLVKEIKKEGAWQINRAKLIIIGLPSLYITLFTLIYYFHEHFVILPGFVAALLLKFGNDVQIYSGIVLGHVLVSSFYKVADSSVSKNQAG